MQLLQRIGAEPDQVDPAHIDESPARGELPRHYAVRMAREKAEAVCARHPGNIVLGADTVVAAGRRILPKAETADEAERCLNLLSGRRHRVYSAVTVIDSEGSARHRLSSTIVAFKPLSRQEIETYLSTGEWEGKAGGYAIQGCAEAWVRFLSGSHSGVIGLPLFETRALLESAGYDLG